MTLPAATIPQALMFSFASQVVQYEEFGTPGVSYFAGWIDGQPEPIHCLLWRDQDGLIYGILNYYAVDIAPFEKAGNVNLYIHPNRKREGLGTTLLQECERRWGPIDWTQQRYSPEGRAFITHYLETQHASS